MAEETKKPIEDIEIDTDDVRQEDLTVEVKESANNVDKKEPAPNLNFGEVDLGGTEHGSRTKDKKEEKLEIKVVDKIEEAKEDIQAEAKQIEQEAKQETSEEPEKDFDSLYKKYKQQNKRIDKLTFREKEALRQKEAAEELAMGMKKKLDDIEKRYNVESDNYLKEFEARVDAQREQVKNNLKLAIENNDTDAIMQANDQLTQLAVQKEKAKIRTEERKAALEAAEARAKEELVRAEQAQKQPKPEDITPSDKAVAFKEKHKNWFGYDKDPALTSYAIALDGQLRQEGIEVDSEEYYTQIEERLKPILVAAGHANPTEAAEDTQKQKKPVQTVASAGRKEVGRKSVTLTKSQVAIAKRLGVPLEEYVKYVKEAR